jgi:predicted transcriptional regulator
LTSALYCTQASTEDRSHALNDLHGAGQLRRQKAAGAIGQEHGPQPFVPRAEAINEYLDVNEWQVAGIKRAIASLDRGEGVQHEPVKDWVTSWGSSGERPIPKRS